MQEQNANNTNDSQFVFRLNLIKGSKGWEIPEFAEVLNVTKAVAANYLSGRTAMKANQIKTLAEAADINPNWLLTGEGQMQNLQTEKQSRPISPFRLAEAGLRTNVNFRVHIHNLLAPIINEMKPGVYEVYEVSGNSMSPT